MPIIRDGHDRPLAVFGYGDIAIGLGQCRIDPFPVELIFEETEPREIGEDKPDILGETTKEGVPTIRLRFERVESLDVLIQKAMQLRDRMMN